MAMQGADVAALRNLARRMNLAGTTLRRHALTLSSQLAGTTWQGPDAHQFKSNWDGQHRATLLRAAELLHESGVRLDRNAAQQEDASAPSGPTTGPPVVPGPIAPAPIKLGDGSEAGHGGAHAQPVGGLRFGTTHGGEAAAMTPAGHMHTGPVAGPTGTLDPHGPGGHMHTGPVAPHAGPIHAPVDPTPPHAGPIHAPVDPTPPHAGPIHAPVDPTPPHAGPIHAPIDPTPPRAGPIEGPGHGFDPSPVDGDPPAVQPGRRLVFGTKHTG